MSNVDRAIIKKLAVKFEGNEMLSEDDHDMLSCYRDLWKTKSEKRNAFRQGIIYNGSCTENCMKLRINTWDKNTSNKQDVTIANAYGDKLIIPFDFEMSDCVIPYHQSGLGNRVYYKIMFNNYD